ncbi:BamA/TamA family outer membrane protein [Larkinella sp. VNQ87]|uniref:translocation and assembly module lipoprotein TamL n=1 Tax=Larkinella sp. VNQ87 TaxID=3400921 RepID=UPI003C12566F
MKRTRIDDQASIVNTQYEFRRKFRNPAHLYRNSFWGLWLLGLLAGLSGCVSSEKLQKNQYLLYSQTVRGNRTIPSADLEALIPQRPNRRILRLPITFGLWAYQLGSKTYDKEAAQRALDAKRREYDQFVDQPDSTKSYKKQLRRFNRQLTRLRRQVDEGNWIMRNLGEPPVYFYEADAKTNAEKMQRYLKNKGFLVGKASYSVDSTTTLGRRVRVTYNITENIPFYLNQVTYQIADSRVDSLVRKTLDRSLLKSGDRFDADKVEAERIRIEELLRNNGYYSFSRQYIPLPFDVLDLDADSSVADSTRPNAHRLNMWVKIVNPPGKSSHPVFKIGEVDVFVARGEDRAMLDTVRHNGLQYLLGRQKYAMRLLDSRIFLRPDSLYRLRNFQDSQRQLFLLNQFRFANISFTDTTGNRLRTRVNLIPIDKYELTTEGGIFVLYQGQGFPGPFGNLSFRIHNIFGGLGTFETSLRYGLEATSGYTDTKAIDFAQEFGLNTSLIFPHILFPGKVRFLFNRLSPRTQIGLGYNYTFRPEYGRQVLRGTVSYNWLKNNVHQYNLFIADINYLRANIRSFRYQAELDSLAASGSTILNSFRNAFASNIGFIYTYNTNVLGQNRRANFLRISLESGGTTLNLFSREQLRSIFNTSDTTGLQYYKYLRANVDFRHYIPIRRKTTLAFRLNTGLVYGYGENKTAPYEKLFFAGGSSSIRAWLPRRLGPGSSIPYSQPDDKLVPDFRPGRPGQFRYDFEQPGDVLIEASAELRTHLFHLGGDINGAFFVDAGNVWTRRDASNRIGENFLLRPSSSDYLPRNFLQQIAVGTGIGLRIDFSFFIIRFDGAIKVYDPARYFIYDPDPNDPNAYIIEGKRPGDFIDERFFLPKFRLDKLFRGPNPLVINFGIGYPF